jgi:peptidoglycan/LPS O-acetylase OafA/YrhL
MIAQFILLAPLFLLLFRRFARMKRPAIGWAALLALSFSYLLLLLTRCAGQSGVPGFLWRWQPKLFLSWMLYFSAGALCGRYYAQFCAWTRRLWPVCLVIVAVGVGLIIRADLRANVAAGAVQFNVVGLQKPVYALLLLFIFVCLQRLAMALAQSALVRRVCTFCGRHSYRGYLAHVECINLLNARLVAHFACLPVYYALLFALTSLAALAAAWLLDSSYGKLESLCRAQFSRRSAKT